MRTAPRSRKIGQMPISWDPDEKTAVERAHDQFRWFGGGWAVNADLPTPAGFEGRQPVRAPGRRRCSRYPAVPISTRSPSRVKEYLDAGFTDVALVQVGDEGQARFLDEAAGPLLQRLREL